MVRCSIAAQDADAGKGGAGLPPDRDGGHKQSERRTHSARASARALVVRSVRNTRFAAGYLQVEPHHLHSIQVGAGRWRVDSEIGPQDVLSQREPNLLI